MAVNRVERPVGSVAVLGAGVMGETLLAGLLRAGWNPDQVVITERRAERAAELSVKYGVAVTGNVEAAQQAETLVVVVKPQDLAALLEEIHDEVGEGTLLVCIAVGISTEYVEARLPDGVAVVRVMPNTPALVDQGMAAMSPGRAVRSEHLDRTRSMLEATGQVVQVAERYQDAVTALSGSGPAYIFYVVEAMIEAGVLLGLPRDVSKELVIQTVYGAATMLKETGQHPTVLREQVSSPAGTTIAAVRQLDDHRVRAAFMNAIEAARDRSRALSSGQA